MSIGVAAIDDPRVDLPHALAVAETACKAAKDRGRNRVELYQASDVSIMRRYEDMNIAPSLRAAISENRLRLDSQLIAPHAGLAGSRAAFRAAAAHDRRQRRDRRVRAASCRRPCATS